MASTSARAIGITIGTALIVGFSVWRTLTATRKRSQTLAEGSRVVGWLVQANRLLFQPGNASAPALLLISFDSPDGVGLERLAAEVARLKSEQPTTKIEKAVAALVRDETYRPEVRVKLPEEFTGGTEVYAVNVWIEREFLPEGFLTQRRILCRATPGRTGPVLMEPPRKN